MLQTPPPHSKYEVVNGACNSMYLRQNCEPIGLFIGREVFIGTREGGRGE